MKIKNVVVISAAPSGCLFPSAASARVRMCMCVCVFVVGELLFSCDVPVQGHPSWAAFDMTRMSGNVLKRLCQVLLQKTQAFVFSGV